MTIENESLAPVRDNLARLARVTDAWHPQTNGVVHTLSRLVQHLEGLGHAVLVIAPAGHATMPLPSNPEIRVTCNPWKASTASARSVRTPST